MSGTLPLGDHSHPARLRTGDRCTEPSLLRESFGSVDGSEVDRYTLSAGGALTVAVATYGGIVLEVLAPAHGGETGNVVLGLPSLDSYVAQNTPYLGAVIGRYANRIANAEFTLDGLRRRLEANEGPHCLHGGTRGFDKRVWQVARAQEGPDAIALGLRYASPDGEGGFPGAVLVEVTYTLSRDDSFRIDYRATTDRPTVINLTSHLYWQLAGEGSGTVEDHLLSVCASRYLPVDGCMIPTGEEAPVAGTPFDFTTPARVGTRLRDPSAQLAAAHGYDHYLVLDRSDSHSLASAARLDDPASGRRLEIATTEPGIQVYSGNHLDGSLSGTSGRLYRQGDGLALETQHYPDSPNRPEFPSTVLRPGNPFASTTVYRLSVVENAA
ncbi:MAG TPA: aldose epimerase family protein [Gaiellaceae bacterium]|nr:aldose epimerase family protein [Gaiellaceae bacterium]HUJ56441.1 aldose epimerase family protein [Gaiellaceae bacterium]